MHHMIPRLALASAMVAIIVAGCDGGPKSIPGPGSPFQPGYPADQQGNPGAIFHVPDPQGAPSQGGGGSDNGQAGTDNGQAGTDNGQAGTSSNGSALCQLCGPIATACPDLAELGFSLSVCQQSCDKAPPDCESCIVAASQQNCDAITNCLVSAACQ